MPINSKEKGKRGERAFAQLLTDFGFPARRGVQYQGSVDSPDVVCPSLPFHFEVKYTERLSLWDAYNQATHDSGGKPPIVAYKGNLKPWMVIMEAKNLLELLGLVKKGIKIKGFDYV